MYYSDQKLPYYHNVKKRSNLGFNATNLIAVHRTSLKSLEICRKANQLRLCSLKAQSLRNKAADFVCYATSSRADVFAVTETWFSERDGAHRAEATPPGFKLLDHIRDGRTGGGTALLVRDSIPEKKADAGEETSFEYSERIVDCGFRKVKIMMIYRIPYSIKHPITTNTFFEEFTSYLESVIMSSEILLITRDFNIHVDDPRDTDCVRFLGSLESMGLQQHVDLPTHKSGHTRDLIITRCADSLLSTNPIADCLFSDHFTVISDLIIKKPSLTIKQISCRKTKSTDIESFKNDLQKSALCQHSPNSLNALVNSYNTTLSNSLDAHAPVFTKTI